MTLEIADDVLQTVQDRARRQNRSAGDLPSDLVRDALESQNRASNTDASESFFGFEPFPPRGAVVSNELIDRLRADEE